MVGTRSGSRSKNPDAEASYRRPIPPSTLLSPDSSLSLKSVTITNWSLVQAEGNGIAVEGFAYRPLGTRHFCSAPIAKRHDSITLETADGITVILGGMINRLNTLKNGFPRSVCNFFAVGFPSHWEEVTAQFYSGERECSATVPGITPTPASFDDLSAIKLRDMVMSIPEGCEDKLCDVLLQQPKDKDEGFSNKGGSHDEEGEKEKGNSEMEWEGLEDVMMNILEDCEHRFGDVFLQQPKDNDEGRSNKGGSHGEEGEKEKGNSEMEGEGLVGTGSSSRVVARGGGVVSRGMGRKKKAKRMLPRIWIDKFT